MLCLCFIFSIILKIIENIKELSHPHNKYLCTNIIILSNSTSLYY